MNADMNIQPGDGIITGADAGKYLLSSHSPVLNAAQPIVDPVADIEEAARPFEAVPDVVCYGQMPLKLVSAAPISGRRVLRFIGQTGRTAGVESGRMFTDWSQTISFVRSNRPLEHIEIPPARDRCFLRASASS